VFYEPDIPIQNSFSKSTVANDSIDIAPSEYDNEILGANIFVPDA
jgi:hypothetical protein